MEILTIGFTKRSAEDFFETLRAANVRRVVDVRLRNSSQLAGFTKSRDLQYFLSKLLAAEYVHEPRLAPAPQMLADYRHGVLEWKAYAQQYIDLLGSRHVMEEIERSDFEMRTALLCAEPTADKCHRRLAAEYLANAWGGIALRHL